MLPPAEIDMGDLLGGVLERRQGGAVVDVQRRAEGWGAVGGNGRI